MIRIGFFPRVSEESFPRGYPENSCEIPVNLLGVVKYDYRCLTVACKRAPVHIGRADNRYLIISY